MLRSLELENEGEGVKVVSKTNGGSSRQDSEETLHDKQGYESEPPVIH
jgi:hypothetical protein